WSNPADLISFLHKVVVFIIREDAASADSGAKQFGPTWFAKHLAPHFASEQQPVTGEIVAHY
ncbi:MAG TPA: hypothetical protein VJZ27_05800, partial [Aggregatilineales bacterium]|nr:hypothetical protein [Aggregatilineales bacterium]